MDERVFAEVRCEFPALEDYTYLDVAGRNPMSNRVRAAVDAFLDDRQSGAHTKPRWFDTVEEVRRQVARLVRAEPDEIALVKNTSEGLNAVATAIDWQQGDSVVVAPELEHPNNIYAWLNLQRRGVEVRLLQPEGAVITAEQVASVMDETTRALTIASVSFCTGGRNELRAIADVCHENGALLIVDTAQSLGIMDLNVNREELDAFAAPTSKGLLGLYGWGVMYCSKQWIEQLTPTFLARYGVNVEESEHEQVMGEFDYELHQSARRFETGNYNYLAAHAVRAGLEQLLEVGTDRIEPYVLGLSRRLTEGLLEKGYRLCSPQDGPALSSVVVFDGGEGGPAVESLSATLKANAVRHAVRRGRIRLAFHFYNNEQDVERVLEVL